MTAYIGLDVHSKQSVFVAQSQEGAPLGQGKVPTTGEGMQQMLQTVGVDEEIKVGLETGAQATWVSRQLKALGAQPVVINAHEVRAKALRPNQKSDLRDARELCEGIRRGLYQSFVYVPDPSIESLRMLISRRRHFVSLGVSQINGAKHLLRSRGLGSGIGPLNRRIGWQRLLAMPEAAQFKDILSMYGAQWRLAQRHKERLEKKIMRAARPYRDTVRLLCTMPGVGWLTATTFIAALGDPRRFPDSGRVVSYVGLAVSTYDSGEREMHGHITKRGNSELRSLLCEAAQHARLPTHPLNPYFRRILGKQGRKQAVVAIAQRMARILYRMWLDGEPLRVGKLNVVASMREETRTVFYDIKSRPQVAACGSA